MFVRKNPEVIFSKVPKQWWPSSDIPIGSAKLVPVVVKPRWTRIFFGRLFSEAVLETEVPQMMSVFKVKRQIVCNKPGKVAWNLRYHLIEKEDNLPNLHVNFPRCISMVSQENLWQGCNFAVEWDFDPTKAHDCGTIMRLPLHRKCSCIHTDIYIYTCKLRVDTHTYYTYIYRSTHTHLVNWVQVDMFVCTYYIFPWDQRWISKPMIAFQAYKAAFI